MKLKIKQSPNTHAKTGIALVAASILLTGCWNSSDNADHEALVSTASAEPPTASPTQYIPASENGPAQNVPEPEMPSLVKEQTTTGAEATIKYFWETYQYLRETGDTTYIEEISTGDCLFCSHAAEQWVRPHQKDNKWLRVHSDIETRNLDLIRVYTATTTSPLTWAHYSFSLKEPATDLYVDGKHITESSVSEPITSEWQAEATYDESEKIWLLDWVAGPGDLENNE